VVWKKSVEVVSEIFYNQSNLGQKRKKSCTMPPIFHALSEWRMCCSYQIFESYHEQYL